MKTAMLLCCAVAYSGVVLAEQNLSGAEISALVTDKTFEVNYTQFNIDLRMFFANDGKALAVSDMGTRRGHWRIDADRFCLSWGPRAETCSTILPLGNGMFKLISNGNEFHRWASACPNK